MMKKYSSPLTHVGISLGAVLLVLSLWVSSKSELSESLLQFTQFLGRFHPLTLHLPIGLFVGLMVVEAVGWLKGRDGLQRAANILLVLTAISSVIAACLGLLLFANGDFKGETVTLHKWLGLAFAVGCLLLLVIGQNLENSVAGKLYMSLLLGLLLVMSLAGHYGGSLTHGSTYLTEYAPEWLKPLMGAHESSEEGREGVGAVALDNIYRNTVEPILQQYCVQCHGLEKQKSRYRLDTYERMLKPGSFDEPTVVPFQPHNSTLVQFMWLHESDELAMPPEGIARPTAEEILAISHWVSLGAEGPKESVGEKQLQDKKK